MEVACCISQNYKNKRADELKPGDLIHYNNVQLWKVVSCERKDKARVTLMFEEKGVPVQEHVVYNGARVWIFEPTK